MTSLDINEHPSFSIAIGLPLGGGLIDVLTRDLLLFGKGLRSVNKLFFLTIVMDVSNGRGTRSGLTNSVQISL